MSDEVTLLVGTVGQGVWRSSDGRQSFRRASRGMFAECDVRALASHPDNPRLLYAGTSEGLYRSEDGADTWTRLAGLLDEVVIWSLLLLPDDPQTILAGTRGRGIFRSDDAGASWQRAEIDCQLECPGIVYTRVTTLKSDPEKANRVWAGIEIDGPWVSDDRGRTWSKRAEGLSSLDIHGLAIMPEGGGSPRTLAAATDNDMNLSTDDGRTWQPQNVGKTFEWPYCRGLTQKANDRRTLFQGNGDGPPGSAGALWRSRDGGRSWQQLDLPEPPNSTIWDFATHPAAPERIYVCSISGQVFLTTDGGDNWEKLPREFGEIRSLLWLPG